ncbi:PREDICTED: protein-methionine sulfoxide oxidase Mical isoform X9 [Bactrocera latifrons]|uniref:protein-methionine sulfoxide oxidase Mical isoform X9 n=1 Tax=Bactrocera latifrons TaxID=174628 RepID=UPI0008DD919A|nr:PREDICTED: protein-methionine sulfoxide oxidase Mical isoform X9 [Bactrocera latifrons]
MSRPTQQRTMPQQKPPKQFLTEQEAIAASELFDLFCVATTMRQILGLHRDMCDILGLRPAPINEFYPMLKAKIRSWKAQALWKKFDARAAHRVYAKGTACNGTHVLVIGAGPCGLRTAIEAQLLGAKVVVLEKRDRITRNNVLHLWPFVITDLRNLGAKKFYGKFCAGSIDHISIRQLQIILIKVALLLGVEIHENVSFERTIEPSGDGFGWRAAVTPADHVVSYYEFDVLIGADGKRNTLEGFKRKEFRGKLAIAITANFINKKTEAEAKAEEISGVAFIFNQSFFKELYEKTGIDLENIVYYKDETHYFVMTAKKHSLIDKGVILQDFSDPAELLASANVSAEKLLDYAREAAEFSTKYQMPNLEFAVNHYGKPDVAMFDFTSMFAAETSCRVMLRHGHRLLQCLVGDSLLEPFWPTGSGCARGFLSSMDAAYATKLWSNPRNSIMGVVAQRESIYRLLNQTTPENLQRDTGSYTVDPASRYPNLNRTAVSPYQVKTLIDTDDPKVFEQPIAEIITTPALAEAPALLRKSRRSTDIVPEALLHWVCTQLHMYDFVKELQEPADILKNGKSLCALISRFRPDLIDYSATRDLTLAERNEVAFRILEAEYQLPRIMSGEKSVDLEKVDTRHWLHYLNQVREVFRGEVPYLKHPKMDISELREKYRLNNAHAQPDFSKLLQLSTKPKYPKAKSPIEDMVDVPQIVQRRSVLDEERVKRVRRHEPAAGGPAAASSPQQGQTDTPRRAKKRRNVEKAANISAKVALAFKKQAASEKCHFCKQIVYLMEKITAEDLVFHRSCLKCHHCHTNLRLGGYAFDRDDPNGRFYCTQHFKLPAKAIRPVVRKPGQRKPTQQQQAAAAAAAAVDITVTTTNAASGITQTDLPKTPDKLRGPADSVVQLDLLDRGQTPERIEFENTDAMSDGEPSEEHILDEHEWSGRNFLPESNQNSESDLSSSDDSDTESDADMFEEANDSPLAAQTLQLATDWIGKQHYSDSDDSDDFYDSSDGIADDDGKDDTEGEDFKKARELRREEVRLQPLPANLPTDTETEVQSESESTSPEEVELNSATEISTDSEFDHDEIIRETPKIFIDDTHLRKPTKVQVKSTVIASTASQRHHIPSANTANAHNAHNLRGSYLQKYQVNPPQPQFKPLVQVDPTLLTKSRTPLQNPRPGDYLLNKTASTEGIASKKSLELKKRYLLGEQGNGNKIQKSGSTSVLDSRIRSFQSNISECQKLLNPGSGISASMKTFLDRTRLGESTNNDLMRSATTNILNDLKVEITIQKASSTASTDNEKENVFVNSKNELNKGMEYSETVNTALVETVNNKKSPSTPTNSHTILATIDLVTPEKEKAKSIIDITKVDIPTKMLESNIDFIENINVDDGEMKPNSPENNDALLTADSNKIIDLTCESPVKSDNTIIEELKPDVSKDVKERIPDLLGHIGQEVKSAGKTTQLRQTEDQQHLLSHSCDEEKMDSPEKLEELFENDTLQIQVPNIPWSTRKTDTMSSTEGSSCASGSSSIEDIQHYILESTTSPDTQTGGMAIGHQVPRVEIHDTSGTLMQIDSLMIIDGKYIGDPEDLKYMEIPAGVVVPETPAIKTSEIEDENEADLEPVTATPEPVECTVIEAETNKLDEDEETENAYTDEAQLPPLPEKGPPLPERGPPNIKTYNLKFDTKNENKVESLKHLPLIVEQTMEHTKAVKPLTLNLNTVQKSPNTPTTPTAASVACSAIDRTPNSPLVDSDITPTGEVMSRGSDSETELTGTQALTETELSDWTADDCISENFIDMEFVLNSNKGTIKRNKKEKRRMSAASKLPTTIEMLGEINKTAPVAEFEGILKSIDIDDIEFMDTGSEGSCAEGYSATNTALLRNRGYVEFIEDTPKQTPSQKTNSLKSAAGTHKPVATKRDEKLGVDYIEQGAYILQSDDHEHDMLKTPVNEESHLVASLAEKSQATGPPSLMTQSLTDSSTLNDLEDDSLFTATPNSQIQLSTATTTKTTTEESEALTVVTSPLDSSSPKVADVLNSAYIVDKGAELTTGSTPSSSDKNPKTSQSTCTTMSSSTTSSNKAIHPHGVSQENAAPVAIAPKTAPRKPSNELSYEECVRALQQKITQISTARDSDVRKQRRKSSKGEMPAGNAQTVIEATPAESENAIVNASVTATASPSAAATQIHKVPEIPTLTRKLEEITKERTKQKDLIHDLVMDKLQSKKQLNAEKRLHRSRQRTMLTSGYASGSSLSPTPKIAAATTTTDTNCTSRAHYHESTAATPATTTARDTEERSNCSIFRDSIPLQKSSTYVSAYGMSGGSPTRIIGYHQRPFSEHLTSEQLDAFERYKLTKTPSFSYGLPNQSNKTTLKNEIAYNFVTPVAPARHNRNQKALISTLSIDSSLSASTENLRTEARARARLKSNTELGLSPEDKMQLLRQRLHLEHLETKNNTATALQAQIPLKSPNDTEQQSICDRRLSASKSVNDLAYLTGKQPELSTDVNSNTKPTGASADFTSDPNLLLSSNSIQSSMGSINNKGAAKGKTSRRQKDPERRKSLIQSLSSFFHKEKKDTGNGGGGSATSAVGSAQSERPGTSGNNGTTASSGIDMGVFGRFRISPKTKERSKSCFDVRSIGFGDKDDYLFEAQLHNNTGMSNAISSNSNIHLNTTPTKSGNKKSSIAALSSSSPQLFIHRPNYVATHEIDEPAPPPIPPLPLNYQRSDDESNATETREQKRQRAISKAVRQAELKRLRIAQEIQREQEEIEVQLKELEARGVLIEKALRGESEQHNSNFDTTNIGSNDENLLKELLEIWRSIKQLKKRDEELSIRQQELQLEHRHAQLKEELNLRLSFNKLDKSSADVAAEGAILNEMLEIVAKRAALRPTSSGAELSTALNLMSSASAVSADGINLVGGVTGAHGTVHAPIYNNDESNI